MRGARTWFSVKIKYFMEEESGKIVKKNDQYLFSAMSYSDVEHRVFEELAPQIRNEVTINNISKMSFEDVINYEDSEIWHKCKVVSTVYDEASEKEKKQSYQVLLAAENIEQAYQRLFEYMSQGVSEFTISSITETAILDVFPYDEAAQETAGLTKLDEYLEKQNVVETAATPAEEHEDFEDEDIVDEELESPVVRVNTGDNEE